MTQRLTAAVPPCATAILELLSRRDLLMRILGIVLSLTLLACTSPAKVTPPPPDEFGWLEEVQGEKPLGFVKELNAQTEKSLQALPSFKRNEAEIKKIVLAKDRIPRVAEMGKYLYNFWQDDKAVRGLWRRTTIAEYKKKNPRWETILDLDKLAKNEKENWVYKGYTCLPPEYARCLLMLSRGGKDAKVTREFDLTTKSFVKDGFVTKEAKSDISWMDENTVMIGTDFGPGSLTSSGYPRILKVWKRGTPLEQATTVLEGKESDVSVAGTTYFLPKGKMTVVSRNMTFYSDETYELTADMKLKKLPKPDDAFGYTWINGRHILSLRSDWKVRGETFKAGSVIALPMMEGGQPQLIFAPNDKQSVAAVVIMKDALLINYLDTIEGKIARAHLQGDVWKVEDLPFPDKGDLSVASSDAYSDSILVSFENFLTPSSVLYAKVGIEKPASEVKAETLKQLTARFDGSKFEVEQLWATSKDGTKVPYYFIHKKNFEKNGATPVLVYGYGGFEVSQGPYYPSVIGKVWLEKGGAYVIANIRGGGEFGPKWHQAALKENRQKAFDDFIAVGEDLVARGISKPEKMAIMGGSNGGLLVGAAFTQRPDLFRAVICMVPLLDMLRYNKLLAGASWEGEYGNPDDPKMQPHILKYSPYQNVKAGVKYPEVFFITSTADDRVHPGHARKMAARMKQQGHPFLYFENIEGGHGAAANLLQRVKFSTLQYTFLQDRLLK
jgi:prolyl oligopeptidase